MKLLVGPCQIESRDHCLMMADRISEIDDRLPYEIIFKASFDKANRTSGGSARGAGIDQAIQIFADVSRNSGLRITTDVHEPWQVDELSGVVDVFQIPALLSRQTDLIQAAARTGKIVNIKKGQFMAPQDMRHAVEKAAGADEVWATERGTSFGYRDLVVDMRSFEIMRQSGADAVIYDATHSVQAPGSLNGSTGGQREFVEPLMMAAIAAGAQGIFVETHDDPDNALSDGPVMVPLDRLEGLLMRAIDAYEAA